MFWDDITEIKAWVQSISSFMGEIRLRLDIIDQEQMARGCISGIVEDSFNKVFNSTEESSSVNRIHDKLNLLIGEADRQQRVLLAEKTLEKFEDYMKNVDKLNAMINEFKGCVSMARGAIAEGRQLATEVEEVKKLASISQDIYKAMCAFIRSGDNIEQAKFFKIDAIYKAVCEKKSRKTGKKGKKRPITEGL